MKFYNQITRQIIYPAAWQLDLKVGDYYCIENPQGAVGDEIFAGPTIYGQIESDKDIPRPGFFWVHGYSQWAPTGELGLFNICEATRLLTEEEFKAARAAHWPLELPQGKDTSQ